MHYVFRVQGHLDPSWQDRFGGLRIEQQEAGTTLLSGSLPDQAALHGLLLQIVRLGLVLLSLETSEAPGGEVHEMYQERKSTMTTFDTLLERNQDFAVHHFLKDLYMMPTLRAMIISCVDPRVDPAQVFGLGPGEAIVIRNIGGRITPQTLQTMGMLGRIAQGEGGLPTGFHLVVLHHTHCGIAHLEGQPDMLASYFGIGQEDLQAKAVSDPHAAVAVDVATLKAIPALPDDWLVSGLVYDVTTGLVETVVPPAPLRPAERPV
jgi:carbonic anhydrase